LPDGASTGGLVVFSACNAGLGHLGADGVVGLARAFLAAGARTVGATLWSVSDRSTRTFMNGFYHHWLKTGLSAHEAATTSTRETLKTTIAESVCTVLTCGLRL